MPMDQISNYDKNYCNTVHHRLDKNKYVQVNLYSNLICQTVIQNEIICKCKVIFSIHTIPIMIFSLYFSLQLKVCLYMSRQGFNGFCDS